MMRSILLCVSCLAILTACVNAGDFALPDGGPTDAGPDAGELGVADCEQDGGACMESPEALRCDELVTACCGETCNETAACAAAQLLQTYEPTRCEDALLDTQTYPRCELGNCDSLVLKVCGAEDVCEDAPGCPSARELQSRSADPEATQQQIDDASSACLQALEDETVFAPCE